LVKQPNVRQRARRRVFCALVTLTLTFLGCGAADERVSGAGGSSVAEATQAISEPVGLSELDVYADSIVSSAIGGDPEARASLSDLLLGTAVLPKAAVRRALVRPSAERNARAQHFAQEVGSSDLRLRQSAIVALGVLGVRTEAEPALLAALDDSEPGIRLAALDAVEALARAGGLSGDAGPQLIRGLNAGTDSEGRARCAAALGDLAQTSPETLSSAVDALAAHLDSDDPTVQIECAAALGRIGGPASSAAISLAGQLGHRNDRVALAAAQALGSMTVPRADRAAVVEAYGAVLRAKPSPLLAKKIIPQLAALSVPSSQARSLLAEVQKSSDPLVRDLAAEASASAPSGDSIDRGVGSLAPSSGVPADPRSNTAWLDAVRVPLYGEATLSELWGALDHGVWVGPTESVSVGLSDLRGVELVGGHLGLVVVEEREGALRVSGLSGVEGENLWVRRSDLASQGLEYTAWSEFLLEPPTPLAFVGEGESPRLWSRPDRTSDSVELTGSHDIEPLEISGDWMRVRVTQPSTFCEGEDSSASAEASTSEAWIVWRDESGPRVWFAARGC